MRVKPHPRAAALVALGGLILAGGLLAGCKGDAQLSNKEIEQFKSGPPKEMPPEAKAMFEKAMRQGAGPRTGQAPAAQSSAGR